MEKEGQKLVDLAVDWNKRLRELAWAGTDSFLLNFCPVYVIIEDESDRDFVKKKMIELSPDFCEKFGVMDGKNAFILGKGAVYQIYEFSGDKERFPVFVVGCREIGENLVIFPSISILRLREFYELTQAVSLIDYVNILFSIMMYNLLTAAEKYAGYRLCFLGVYDRNDFLQKKEVCNFISVLGVSEDELKKIWAKETNLKIERAGFEYDGRIEQGLGFLLKRVDSEISYVLLSDFVANVHWRLEKRVREWAKENALILEKGLSENRIEYENKRDEVVEIKKTEEGVEIREEKEVKKKGKRKK